MIKVHHLNNSRSQRILWMLEELNLEYKIVVYERDLKTLQGPASLRNIHPLGKSPVITDDGSGKQILIAESGAIIEYLSQTYGKNSSLVTPKTGSQQERDFRYWLHFSEGSLMPPLLLSLIFDRVKRSRVPFFVKPITKAVADKVLSEARAGKCEARGRDSDRLQRQGKAALCSAGEEIRRTSERKG